MGCQQIYGRKHTAVSGNARRRISFYYAVIIEFFSLDGGETGVTKLIME
jgi:hypothetical protein